MACVLEATMKQKFDSNLAWTVATEVMSFLSEACDYDRCVVAGSLRRQKPTVSDVEILYVSKRGMMKLPGEMFEAYGWLADEAIGKMESKGVLARRLNVKGSETFGPQNKLMVHVKTGVPVDLFNTTDHAWWVSLVIRTGPKESNLMLASTAQAFGRKMHAYGSGVTMPDGTEVRAESERHVFELCGCRDKYKEPKDR